MSKGLCEVRIDLGAIAENLAAIRSTLTGRSKVMAVLKADAYGHGGVAVAKRLVRHGVDYFAVAHVGEAKAMREAGIKARILVLQPDFHLNPSAYRTFDLECLINGFSDLTYWQTQPGKPVACHLFTDSGMGREGVLPAQFLDCFSSIEACTSLNLVGIGTHFACADEPDLDHSRRQLACFQRLLAVLPAKRRGQLHIHAANSGAILNLPESHFDFVRPGIWLYGQYTGAGDLRQRPVMTVIGRIHTMKEVPAGTTVGYGATHITTRKTWLGLISAGYADGFARAKSNRALVRHGRDYFPIVGRVSMDQLVIDLGAEPVLEIGAEVVLAGGPFSAANSIAREAEALGTITYERCCHYGLRFPKVFYE